MNAPPLCRWQSRQWHRRENSGSPSHSYRILPHEHPPVLTAVMRNPLWRRLGNRLRIAAARRAEEAMAYETILVEHEDGVGIITLNRPDKLNAMNRQLNGELRDAVKAMDADD